MSAKRALVGICILAAVCATAQAQKDAEAAQILAAAARNAGVAGGGLASLVATGTWTALDSPEPTFRRFTVKALAPDRVRWEVETEDGLVVTAVSGSTGWTRLGGVERGLSAAEAAFRGVIWFPLLALSEWIASPSVRLEPPTPEGHGSDLHRIGIVRLSSEGDADARAALEAIGRIELVADRGRGRAIGVRFEDRSGSDWRLASQWRLEFDDFRPVGGVLTPHTINATRAGVPVQSLVFDSVQINAPVGSEQFLP